jgi:hypothetical protein
MKGRGHFLRMARPPAVEAGGGGDDGAVHGHVSAAGEKDAAACAKGSAEDGAVGSLLEAVRGVGRRRAQRVDVLVVWAAAQAAHWLLQQPAEWLLLALYSVSVIVRLLALRPLTAVAWLAAWAVLDYCVYVWLLPAASATAASLMVHSVIVVRLQGCNLRGAALLAVAAALVFARESPTLTAWHRALAAHCTGPSLHTPCLPLRLSHSRSWACVRACVRTCACAGVVFGVGWLATTAAATLYEQLDDWALALGLREPDPPAVVVADVSVNTVRLLWSQTSGGRQCTREVQPS